MVNRFDGCLASWLVVALMIVGFVLFLGDCTGITVGWGELARTGLRRDGDDEGLLM